MASFDRNCPQCFGEGAYGCPGCGGTGRVQRAITVTVKIAPDNREPIPFHMTIEPGGAVHFVQAGHRKGVSTSVQSMFNRARVESAQVAKVDKKRAKHKLVKRGLITIGRSK